MKKILFVIENLYNGGAERVTAALVSEWCQKDMYEVHLLILSARSEKEYYIDPKVIRHDLPLSMATSNKISAFLVRQKKMKQAVEEIKPHCIISLAMPITQFRLSLIALSLNIPLILSERNDPRRFPREKMMRLLRKWAYHKCDGMVFQTQGAQKYFSNIIQKKSTVICNPITSCLPDPYVEERNKQIVTWCRLSKQKNLSLLIDAFADIADEFPEYQLYIYGEGEERAMLENKIALGGLQDRIYMPGHSLNIFKEVYSAALFVSSSDYEGVSNSMLEALSLGIPCICTDCPPGGAKEVIENGKNGILVPTGNRDALANGMRQLLSDTMLSESLGAMGATLKQKINITVITDRWIDFSESILKKKRSENRGKF